MFKIVSGSFQNSVIGYSQEMKQEVFSMYENNDPNTENNESSTYR